MKKITLFLFSFLTAAFLWQANAQQVLLSEGFDGGVLPVGWSVEHTAGTNETPGNCGAFGTYFSFECTNGLSFSCPTNPNWTGNIATMNDDDAGSGLTGIGSIITSSVDLSNNLGGDYVSFDYGVDTSGGPFTVDAWDGSSWDNLLTVNSDQAVSESIDIAAYSNADFAVRFSYDDGGNWAWGAAVDNVVIAENYHHHRIFSVHFVQKRCL